MAQASAAARLLRQRPCDPTAAGMLSSRVLYRFLSKQPAASVASTACKSSSSSWSLCAWFGSHPRRQLNAASAATTRTLHHALSSAATVSSEATTPASQSQLLGFIKSTFGTLEGQNHCWLNAANGIWRTFDQEGTYLVLLYQSCGTLDSQNKRSAAFERLKCLQQRYSHLNVFALQFGSGVSSLAAQSQAVRTIMKEYITFPILLSDKEFTNMTNGACYLLFEGSKDHILSVKLDEEPELMMNGMEGFSALSAEPSENVLESKVSWQKEEVIKEPYVGSLRNLLLYHPGCVSVDEDGDRFFISDSNHHRIIISNSDGIIIDFIGSSPGFEHSEFESAKLLHPAASFYHAAEDCLYIVDSENHAVRKADFAKRFLETVYPVFNKKSSGIWSWITDKLGLTKDVALNIQDFDADSVTFPWHLLQISEDDLLVADRNFETSWILNMSTGEKQDIAKGRAEAMELCQQTINERRALLKDMLMNGSSGDKEHSNLEKISCNELLSSISRFQKYVVFCDTDGQRVLKHDLDTRDTSSIHFMNLGVLGLPYWFVCSLERVSTWGHSAGQFQEHTRKVNVLPGRCNIKVSVDIPVDTELAAPLVESCIWRQVRGSGAEISESDGQDTTPEKWVLSSKEINFPYPVALTLMHMVFSSVVCFAATKIFKVIKIEEGMTTDVYVSSVIPIGAMFAMTLWLGNSAYLYISVAFAQMLKAIMPVAVFLLGTAFGLEEMNFKMLAIMSVISVGVVVASVGEITISWIGVVYQMGGVVAEALRLIFIEIFLKKKGVRLNLISMMYYVSPCSALCLFIPWLFLEKPKMDASVTWNFPPVTLFLNCMCTFILNLSVFLVISRTSALTARVTGVVRDWSVVLVSAAIFADTKLTFINIVGYVIAIAGVLAYNNHKLGVKPQANQQQGVDSKVNAGSPQHVEIPLNSTKEAS